MFIKTKYLSQEGKLWWGHYKNESPALVIKALDGEVLCKASINMDIKLEPDEICIKDYSENEGILECLVMNGIIQWIGKVVRGEYIEVPICKILKRE